MAIRGSSRTTRPLTLALVAGATVVGLMLLSAIGALPNLPSPFATDRNETRHPALLQSLQDLADYHASTGEFQVIVEIDDDARYLPDFLKGEEVTLLAVGTVDGVVDFTGLAGDLVVIGDDSATITLPAPTLSDPHIDLERTEVISRNRGLLDRVGGLFSDSPTSEHDVLLLAEDQILAAATESELLARARINTAALVEALVTSLGVEQVTVVFDAAPVVSQ